MTTSPTTFRAAIIGTGRIADLYDDEIVHYPDIELPPGVVHTNMYSVKPVAHAGAYRTVDGYELVAAASRGRDRLKQFGARHHVDALYTDYREMLAVEQPDVVSICTQSPAKHDAVMACAEAGVRAVIVEKAFATSMDEADSMLDACKASGTLITTHHPMRFSVMFRRIKELIDAGAIGDVATITCHAPGALIHGTHAFDLVRYLGGDASTVMAVMPGLRPDPEMGDPLGGTYADLSGDAIISLASGATAIISMSTARPEVDGIDVRGTNGYITAPFWIAGVMLLVQRHQRAAAEYGYEDRPGGRPVQPVSWETARSTWDFGANLDQASAIQRHLRELYATLTTDAPFVSTGQDGADALELGLACFQSGLLRTQVEVPLSQRSLRVINR